MKRLLSRTARAEDHVPVNVFRAFPAMFMEELLVAGTSPLYSVETGDWYLDPSYSIPYLIVRPLQYSAIPGIAQIEFHGSIIRTYRYPHTHHHSSYQKQATRAFEISDTESVRKLLAEVRRLCYG